MATAYGPRSRKDDYSGVIENLKETSSILDWTPKTHLEDGIKKYIEWYKGEVAKR